MYKVGLTGGVGVGKTTVSNIFRTYGIEIIDADQIAKELTSPGTKYYDLIIEKFGNSVIKNGILNRIILRDVIFNNMEYKLWLEKLLHPPIISTIIKKSDCAKSEYCILAIPLLIEKKLQYLVDNILVVTASASLQKMRTIKRDQSNEHLFESIRAVQCDEKELLIHANETINNDGHKNDLMPEIEKLHSKYIELASKKSR